MNWYKRAKDDKPEEKEPSSTLSITHCEGGGYIIGFKQQEDGYCTTEAILVPEDVKIIKNELV